MECDSIAVADSMRVQAGVSRNGVKVEWWLEGGASLLNELVARHAVLGPYLLFQKGFQLT